VADQNRNLNPHAEARLAMAIWEEEYAYKQTGGSMDFWDSRTDRQKALCVNIVDAVMKAAEENGRAGSPSVKECGTPPPRSQMVAGEINITLAAQRIFEVFCGGPVDWSRHSLNDADDNVFASADWAQAMLYAKAAFAAAPAEAIAAATTDLWVGSAGAVPEDIRQAAQKAWDDAMALTSDAQSEMVIAQAILAERQAPPLQLLMGSETVAIQALKKIEAAALGGYLTPDLCAEIVTSALAPEATPTSSFDVESWAAGDGVWNGDKWVPAGNSEGKR